MFKPNEQLKVKTVRRYTVPRYPSSDDPNPLESPDRPPYKISRPVAIAIGMGFLAAGRQAPAQPATNPFPATNLPQPRPQPLNWQVGGFGTGAVMWTEPEVSISRSDVLDVVTKIFKDEGIIVETEVSVKLNDVEFQCDLFSLQNRIGFEFYKENFLETLAQENLQQMRFALTEICWAKPKLFPWLTREEIYQLPQEELIEKIAIGKKEIEREELFISEAIQLEEYAKQGKAAIIVINDAELMVEYDKELSSVERAHAHFKGEAYLESLYQQRADEALKLALKELEQKVREYLRWARSQGVQW